MKGTPLPRVRIPASPNILIKSISYSVPVNSPKVTNKSQKSTLSRNCNLFSTDLENSTFPVYSSIFLTHKWIYLSMDFQLAQPPNFLSACSGVPSTAWRVAQVCRRSCHFGRNDGAFAISSGMGITPSYGLLSRLTVV